MRLARVPALALFGMLALGSAARGQEVSYEPATAGTKMFRGGSGFSLKMLIDESNLGDDTFEVGEIVFPAGSRGTEHRHRSTEIFYILEGELDHVVNGESHRLTPGMAGIVRAGDRVLHRVVSPGPVRALVIWTPAGEAGRIASSLTEVPIEP